MREERKAGGKKERKCKHKSMGTDHTFSFRTFEIFVVAFIVEERKFEHRMNVKRKFATQQA